jgi:formylglycine-generating enzyme required for sulfatase activity
MTNRTIDQRQQQINGNQFNAAHDINIAQAQFNLPPEFLEKWLSINAEAAHEDLGRVELVTEAWEPDTVLVAAGAFRMGTDSAEGIPARESPQFQFVLPTYRIGIYPVTNKQYAYFTKETDRYVSPQLGWQNGQQPSDEQSDHPVRGVTWYDALAYCKWLMEMTDRPYTLPSETQWEKAARGLDARLYPWGNEWNPELCNTSCHETTPVQQFTVGKSPYGCFDCIGNVREWTSSLWGRRRHFRHNEESAYPWSLPWQANQGRDEIKANRQIRRVTRGGASLLPDTLLRVTRRNSELPYNRGIVNARIGFRVAINVEEQQ